MLHLPNVRILLHPIVLLVAALVVLALSQGQAYAATITVNTTSDELAIDGNCSLREAIEAANTDTAVDACPAGSGADVIVVPAGTYTLTIPPPTSGTDDITGGDLNITNNLTINGAGAASTVIQQTVPDRVFDIPSSVVVTISGLTIEDGRGTGTGGSGGGIRNDGNLTVTNSTIRNNSASGAGGGIRNDGPLVVMNSTFNGNSASTGGGGIENNFGTLTVTNSTITNNSSGAGGGGIENKNTATIFNSTLSGNVDGQISFGGGGIRNTATVSLKSTILADSVPSGTNCSGTITSLGYNLSSDPSCFLSGTGDLNNMDPKLGSLQNNGGPTLTQALLTGSPAINSIPVANCTDASGSPVGNDQRGVPRPQGTACDMGAFELAVSCVSAPPWPVPLGDSDCDGFTDAIENFVGTAPFVACGGVALSNGTSSTWPPDFNNDNKVTITDILLLRPHFNTAPPNPNYSQRYDLNADGAINLTDVLKIRPFFALSCTP